MREVAKIAMLAGFIVLASAVCGVADVLRDWRGPPRKARGRASWYGDEYRGHRMANGEPFDPDARTCATRDWPLNAVLRVKAVATGRIVFVTVTDRGPARWTGCVLDLSRRAFEMLAPPAVGHIEVEIDYIPDVYEDDGLGAFQAAKQF